MMLEVIPIPAFRDNYIWLLRRDGHAVVVDPGDAAPVLDYLETHCLTLDAILITHHHHDHIGGVATLQQRFPSLTYAPARKSYAFPHTPVGEGDRIRLDGLDIHLTVMETPGHTLDHVAYYDARHLFCGDTLFSGGCGRLFEGTCEQLYHSLQRLAALPPEIGVYCTHEYTRHNLDFALTLTPDNPALLARSDAVTMMRNADCPTLPSTITLERASNPFLRCDDPDIVRAATRLAGRHLPDPVSVFCTLRAARNHF